MPGPHLTLSIFQCFPDVGGCDAWLSNWWGAAHQWWVGWHSPKPLTRWAWPSPIYGWTLIGHERWRDLNGISLKAEALYAHPNPSVAPWGHDLTPCGHWHVRYDAQGNETARSWSDEILSEGELYLKGKGKGQNKGNGYAKGKGYQGKGSGKGGKGKGGKGKGKGSKGKNKGKNKDKGKGKTDEDGSQE